MLSQIRIRRFSSLALLVLMQTAFAVAAFAQEAAAEAGGEAAATPEASHTVLQTIMGGGPLIIAIWCAILGTSVTMVTLIVQNIMTLKPSKLAPPPLVQSLQQTIASGN